MEFYAEKLNALMEKNRDAEKGFAKAADYASAKSLATWFNDRAIERSKFNENLKMEILPFGLDFDEGGSMAGDVHRTWMDIKALFAADNDEAMLAEALRGEKAALEEYNSVLGEANLPASIKAVLTDQRAKIELGLSILRTLDNIEFQEES